MPRVPTPLPGVDNGTFASGDDPWAMAEMPEVTEPRAPRRIGRMIYAVVAGAIVIGSIGLGVYAVQRYGVPTIDIPFLGARVVEPVEAAPEVLWSPPESELLAGVGIGDVEPSTLGWSDDGTQLGWKVFDESKATRVTYVVQVGDTFSEPEVVRPSPLWVSARRGPVSATAENGLVVLTDAITRNTQVLDPRDLLGVVGVHAPSAIVRGDRILVAFAGRPTVADDAPWAVHVVDVTDLLRPPPPPAAPDDAAPAAAAPGTAQPPEPPSDGG